MANTNTLAKQLLNVKNVVVENVEFFAPEGQPKHLLITARSNKRHYNDCPYCHRRCQYYDRATQNVRTWRGLDFGGIIVEVASKTHRVQCPVHGIVTADVPWAYPGSGFTKEFDLTVAWMAEQLPRSAVSESMRIDWKTVGRCMSRALKDLEPDRSVRLNGLVNIGIDETSYKKGYKYLTVIVNHDTGAVVWASVGHGKQVLERFFLALTPEQRSTIRVVTGDGAKWITECVNEFIPGSVRCIDGFHVVEWCEDALDAVRLEVYHEARANADKLAAENPPKRGRRSANDKEAAEVAAAKAQASSIKGSAYAPGKNPDHLTNHQKEQLAMISKLEDTRLYRAYAMKEELRLILKLTDVEEAEKLLKHWLFWASHSRIKAFKDLYEKVKRHQQQILDTIRYGMSNARVEATNNKIKLLIRKAFGFRNTDNLLDMIYLTCSDIKVPLPNRIEKPKKAA